MVPVKALDVLLRACAELKSRRRRLPPLPGRGRAPEEVAGGPRDGPRDRRGVTFAGPRPQHELPDWYRASDVVVLPSYSEGIPNVLREAQACGRPFVATRVGGIPEVADPATSRLVAPGSPAALAGAIRATLAEPPDPAAVAAGSRSASWEESARAADRTAPGDDQIERPPGPRRSARRARAMSEDRGNRTMASAVAGRVRWPAGAASGGPSRAPAGTPGPEKGRIQAFYVSGWRADGEKIVRPEFAPPRLESIMRILAITTIFPRAHHETAGPYNDLQFRELAVHHEVTVIAPIPWTEELKDRLAGRGIPRFYVNDGGVHVHHPRYYFTPRILQDRYGEFYRASIRPTFERAVRARRPDVVLGCFAHPDGWAAVRLAARPACRPSSRSRLGGPRGHPSPSTPPEGGRGARRRPTRSSPSAAPGRGRSSGSGPTRPGSASSTTASTRAVPPRRPRRGPGAARADARGQP